MTLETQYTLQEDRRKLLRNTTFNGQALIKLVEVGLAWLRTNQQIVNALNVFPVPDGDTGINMVLTMQSALDEIANSTETNIGKMAHAMAHGALMGARGNSGVILSQLMRGFARALDSQELMDGASLVRAFCEARDTAYKGVVRPVEGTILTVAKDIATAAVEAINDTDDPITILDRVISAADKSVEHTPELLDELKKAGVVDAGGKGLFYILEGMQRYIDGLSLETPLISVQPLAALTMAQTRETIEPGQDYELVIDFHPSQTMNLEQFYTTLQAMGTSIQLGEGDGIYRVHIHVPTEKRYQPIDYTLSLGTITKVSIENLLAQMDELGGRLGSGKLELSPVVPGQIAVVAVSPGPGIARVFANLGVAAVVEGGQTMNPSTQDILNAFENLPTDNIVILPNNKNIILAAQAAADISVKKVAVIPSRSTPEGLAAMLRLIPDGDYDSVVKDMTNTLQDVQTGEITTATRSVEIDGVKVEKGQIITLLNDKLVASASTIEEACLELLEIASAKEYELITLFYGEGITKEEANQISELICSNYPELEVEVQEGGQPYYQYIISIE